MKHPVRLIAAAAAAALALSPPAQAQTASGQARAVQTVVHGALGDSVSTLADTGTLAGASDARQASASSGSVPLVSANTLHATAIGMTAVVDSESSVADLAVSSAAGTIGADFVMSRVSAAQGAVGTASAIVQGLSFNGVPLATDGTPNQTLAIPGGRIVVNEQQTSGSTAVANALHIILDGVADIVVASASAAVR